MSTTKIQALDVLLELSTYCSAETVLDRIVPYIVSTIFMFKYFKKVYFKIKFYSSFYSGIINVTKSQENNKLNLMKLKILKFFLKRFIFLS